MFVHKISNYLWGKLRGLSKRQRPMSTAIENVTEPRLSNFNTLAKFHLKVRSVKVLRAVTSFEIHVSYQIISKEP